MEANIIQMLNSTVGTSSEKIDNAHTTSHDEDVKPSVSLMVTSASSTASLQGAADDGG